jgi:hypothetical protein
VRAVDPAGNVGRAAATRTVTMPSETAATAAGSWRTARAGAYLGGAARVSSSTGASLTYGFTGRAVALTAARTPTSGQLRIRVDGELVGTVDLRAGTAAYRQVVWNRSFGAVGAHTVRVEVVGTAGRPGVIVDGFVTIR